MESENLNVREEENKQEPENEEDSSIKYSESYSKMNLVNKLSTVGEMLSPEPISNNVIKTWNLTEEFERLEPVSITGGRGTRWV